MEIKFNINQEDHIAFGVYIAEKKYNTRKIRWSSFFIVIAFLFIVITSVEGEIGLIPFSVLTLFCLIFYIFFYKWFLKKITHLNLKNLFKGTVFTGTVRLNIDNNGLHFKEESDNSKGEQDLLWTAIKKIEENENYIYLFVDLIRALIIPKRDFKTPQETSVFLDEINKYWKNNSEMEKTEK